MWPYNDDEAGWLTPPKAAEPPAKAPVNDNDPARRVPLRALPAPPRKPEPQT
jgi:hypothetical protein